MKVVASAVLFSCLVFVGPQRSLGAEAKNDPGQFPLPIHISASIYAPEYGSSLKTFDDLNQIVTSTIDGKHYQLVGPASSARHSCTETVSLIQVSTALDFPRTSIKPAMNRCRSSRFCSPTALRAVSPSLSSRNSLSCFFSPALSQKIGCSRSRF